MPVVSHPRPSHKLPSDWRIYLLVLVSAVPTIGLLFYLYFDHNISLTVKIALTAISLLWIAIVAASVREKIIHHIRTLSNLIEALRAEDYSLKGSRAREPGELAELYQQINALNNKLKESRQIEFELENLLEKVVNQINVAIIACDADDSIRLVNKLASKLLNKSPQFLIGVELRDTELKNLPLGSAEQNKRSQLIDHVFPGAEGRWQINQQFYRDQGKPGRIIFITDLKQVLNEEEVNAWQRLIRVIGHEVNNSLTPITSICQTVESLLARPAGERNDQDIRDGLSVIAERAKNLKNFISVYARIARLPEPQKVVFTPGDLMKKIQRFFSPLERAANDQQTVPVECEEQVPTAKLFGDLAHLEQVLINLIKNAIEASSASREPVKVSVQVSEERCEFVITDSGTGISNTANLFVPFYTTKSQGAGIGLTLCRQIASKHGGHISLENRSKAKGTVAKLVLPLAK